MPGLVDAHCHVGVGPGGAHVEDPDALRKQALDERAAGVLALRDCGSPVDTRFLDDEPDLPRIIRAGRHIAAPRRYMPDLARRGGTGRPRRRGAGAGPPRRRLGEAGRRLDRPRRRRPGARVARRRPGRGDRRRPRGGRPGHRAHVRHRRAARPDRGRHRLHRARHRPDRGAHRRHGGPRHRRRPHAGQRRELPRFRGGGGAALPGLREHHAPAVRAVGRRRPRRVRGRCAGVRRHRRRRWHRARVDRRRGAGPARGRPPRRGGAGRGVVERPRRGWASAASRRAHRPTSSSTTPTPGPTSTPCSARSGWSCAAGSSG